MEINIGMDGDIVVMDITGDLVANTAEELKAQVEKLTEKNFVYILLEMHKVNFMDSSGLGACMAVYKKLRERNGALVCARPSEAVSKIFRITKADKKISVVSSSTEGAKLLHEMMMKGRQK